MDDKTKRIINESSSHDFDGHTDFSRMTADERLLWLDEANSTFLDLYARANPALRVAEDDVPYDSRKT